MPTIDRITVYAFSIPLTEPFVISRETVTDAPGIIIRIQDSDGAEGFGECTPFQSINGEVQAAQFALAPALARQWIGEDSRNIKARMHDLDRFVFGNTNLKSAFDLALYDLNARHAGEPLYRYLGGDMVRSLPTDMTIGIDRPEVMAEQAIRFVRSGFETIKVKLGKSAAEDKVRLDAIRKAVGPDIDLRIDANQGWTREDALSVLQHAGALGIGHCEEPIARWDLAGQVYLTANSPVPIMADESLFTSTDAQRLIDFNACHQFNLKLGKSGGILDGIRILQLATENNIICQVGCFSETRFAITALAHLVYAYPIIHYYDMDSPIMLVEDPVQGGIRYTDQGTVELDDHEPGIGATWDPAFFGPVTTTGDLLSTLIGPGQSLTIFTILVLAAAAGIVGEARGWYGKVSGVFITILGCALLVTFNVIPSASDQQVEVPAYQFVFTYFVPFSIPLLLFNAQIKKIWREAGRLTVLFLLGTVGVIIGAIIAYLVINLGPDTSKVASVFIGTYTGGSVNFMSVAAALDFVRSPLFAACVAVDNVYTNVYFLLIFTIPVWSIIRRFYPYYSEEEKEIIEHKSDPIASFKIENLAQILLITAAIVAIGVGLNGPLQQLLHTSIQMDIVVITILTLVLVNVFPAYFSKLEPTAFPIGVWMMFVFIAAIGAASDIKAILHSSPAIIGFVSIILVVHFLFIMLAGYWLKFSLKEIAIASIANIGGPSVSAPMAANYGMKMAVTPAILIAILGYVIGTILGIGFGAITG